MKKLTLAALAALAVGGAYMAIAQDKTTSSYFPDSLVQEKTGPSMESCRQMMSDMSGMTDTQMAQDRKIDLLVSRMNETTGDSKANATAAVVTELVVQRNSHRGMQMRMDGKMHMHMMQHAKSGKMNCPMMGGMVPPAQ
jgi:hypothetical protein